MKTFIIALSFAALVAGFINEASAGTCTTRPDFMGGWITTCYP